MGCEAAHTGSGCGGTGELSDRVGPSTVFCGLCSMGSWYSESEASVVKDGPVEVGSESKSLSKVNSSSSVVKDPVGDNDMQSKESVFPYTSR